MINERSSAQANTPTSANMQYSYASGHFDLMSIPPMQNPNDLYSYYQHSVYQPFSAFDEHNQWATADSSGNVPPPGPMQYHHQMYTPSPLDLSRSPFDYPPLPHAYPHYHPGFTASTFPGPPPPPPPSTGTSAFDMSWSPHSLPMQPMQMPQQQMTPIGGGPASSKKPSVYDEYPPGGVSDMLAQQMNAVNLGGPGNNDDHSAYDNGTNDGAQNVNVSSAKDQQHYQSNSSNLSISARATQATPSGGPKSYASVVSADTLNLNSNKPTSAVSNMPARSATQPSTIERNNPTSNYSNDSMNSRPNSNLRGNNSNNYPQQTRNGTSGYNSRHQQQQQQPSQQHQQSSGGGGGGGGSFLSWSNNNLPSNSRGGNNNMNTSTTYYNSGASNYYDRSSYSQQQQPPSYNNKRHNSNYQQNYFSSRTTHQTNNGNAAASAVGQQPISAANQDVLDTLKKNHQYNPRDLSLNTKGARFFVIKSYSEDDVHRSIKYNIWCSTEHGNKRLDDAFREREGKGPIYLFFSVNASGHFCGMAEMMSSVDYEHQTDVWQVSNKWQGKFEVKWIYVKDVPNQQFRNIRLENNDNKPVTNSRDTQEIPYEKGKLMLKNMHMYRDKTSIFDDFQYYESKQAEEVVKKPTNNEYGNNHQRGANNNKRQYSSNRPTSSAQSDQPPPQQHEEQQQETESPDDEDNN